MTRIDELEALKEAAEYFEFHDSRTRPLMYRAIMSVRWSSFSGDPEWPQKIKEWLDSCPWDKHGKPKPPDNVVPFQGSGEGGDHGR